jgi:hypothetical protein
MTFFLRFFFRKVKRRRNRRSDGQTTYPCESVETVLVVSSLSTSMWIGPDLKDIRARSATLVVWVAEKSIDWRFSRVTANYITPLRHGHENVSPLGSIEMILFISSSKPISSILSASSITKALRFRNTKPFVSYIPYSTLQTNEHHIQIWNKP